MARTTRARCAGIADRSAGLDAERRIVTSRREEALWVSTSYAGTRDAPAIDASTRGGHVSGTYESVSTSGRTGRSRVKTEADAVLDDLRKAVRAGTFDKRGVEPPREVSPLTFRQLAEVYKERHVFAKGLAIGKTINYRLKPLIDQFGERPIAEIRTADVEDFIADLRKPRIVNRRPNRTLTNASINRSIELLRHMLNWAIGRGYLDRTPFRRGTETLIRKLHEDNRRRRRLTEVEETRLLEVAPPFLRSMIITALDTGMRQGEMLALRFGDIDWERQVIVLRGETTKSRKSHPVPIATARLRAVLEWLRLEADGQKKPDEALVFSDETGDPVGRFRTAWVTAVLKAHGVKPEWKAYGWTGLTPECAEQFRRINLHWHDMRHEYASRLVEKGVPLAQVRDLLGHASITTTERYDNQKLESLQAAAARLESGKGFDAPSRADESRTECQVFVKNSTKKALSDARHSQSKTGPKALDEGELENWLGGRDSNPDTVVQRAVNGFRSVSLRSVLFQFSELLLQWVPVHSALFTREMSHRVSGLHFGAARPQSLAVLDDHVCDSSSATDFPCGLRRSQPSPAPRHRAGFLQSHAARALVLRQIIDFILAESLSCFLEQQGRKLHRLKAHTAVQLNVLRDRFQTFESSRC